MRRLSVPALLVFSVLASFAAEWRPIEVPGAWDATTAREVAAAGDTAWYRTWVKVHDSFFTKHERNLYEESVGVNLRDLEDAHEVWVNGVKIGTGGAFPPHYESGRAAIHRHKVPVGKPLPDPIPLKIQFPSSYNLKSDLGETQDLAKRHPEKVRELHERLLAYLKRVDAEVLHGYGTGKRED